MSRGRRYSCRLWTTALCLAPLAIVSTGTFGAETGNVCVRDYQPGAVCTANDVRIEQFFAISVIEGCLEGVPNETEIELRALVSADGSPDRYDIGLFLDLSGDPLGARDGDNCFHEYLPPPLTGSPTYGDENTDGVPDILNGPWWDGGTDADTCGDIETNTQILIDFGAIRLPCVDNDDDGFVDLHACASWDNNTNTACNSVQEAFPGTNSKCSCSIVPTPEPIPIPVDLIEYEVD